MRLLYTLRMNFLAHLHLAHLADSSLLGNLLADFVRGDPAPHYSLEVVQGIRLHRRIDAMIDQLPEVRAAKAHFIPEHRRLAPITLDILWDHFLSLHWDKLEPSFTLPQFVQHAQQHIQAGLAQTPERFQQINQYLWPERWMERYAELPFIARVLQGMAHRRPKLMQLTHTYQDIEQHYERLERHFWNFYPALIQSARRKEL